MSSPCRRTARQVGVHVKALSAERRSGNRWRTVCILGTRTYIKHVVRVTNKMLYPADIRCVGKISTVPANVFKFSFPALHSNLGDTETRWSGEFPLDDGESNEFAHVTLLPKLPSLEETVHAEVTITWPDPNRRGFVKVGIKVIA